MENMSSSLILPVLDNGSWRTPEFRRCLVEKLEETWQECGTPTMKSAAAMEEDAFSKARNKTEYLGLVARLILLMKEKTTTVTVPSSSGGGGQGQGQLASGVQIGGQINLDRKPDACEAFGTNVAETLRKFSGTNQEFVKAQIQQLLAVSLRHQDERQEMPMAKYN